MHPPGRTFQKTVVSAGLLLVALVVYWPATGALVEYWLDPESGGSHGLLVAVLCGWLLWRAFPRLADVPLRGSLIGSVLLVLCSLAWLIFLKAGIQDLQLLMLPAILLLAVFAALGWRATRVLGFAIGFLGFALPAWGTLGDPLQILTAWAVGVIAPAIGLPVRMSGFLAYLPNGTFEVARGCSGINFFVVGLAIAALLGELEEGSIARRAMLLATAGLLAIVSNWIRVLSIIALGYATDMRNVLVTSGHLLFGWVLFVILLVAYVWIVTRRTPALERKPTPTSVAATAPMAQAPLALFPLVLAAVALGMGPALDYISLTQGRSAHEPLDAPVGRASWQGPQLIAGGAWQPVFIGRHVQWHVAYSGAAGRDVEVVGVGYDAQEQGRELVNEGNSLLGADALTVIAVDVVNVAGNTFTEAIVADHQGRRSVVWSVYDIDGRRFVIPLLSQLWYGLRSLGGAPYSALFAFRAACEPNCDAARQTLGLFVEDMSSEVFAVVVRERPHTVGSKPI
jgi:exosortase